MKTPYPDHSSANRPMNSARRETEWSIGAESSPGASERPSEEEIESLLKLAREQSKASDRHLDDLGPGDVQYLRGDSESHADSAIEAELVARLFGSMVPTERKSAPALASRAEAPIATPPREPQPLEEIVTPPLRSAHDGLTIEDLGDVDLDVSIELGRTEILIEEILKLREGAVVTLDKLAGDPVDILANGKLVGRGELLVIDGKFGVRLSEVL